MVSKRFLCRACENQSAIFWCVTGLGSIFAARATSAMRISGVFRKIWPALTKLSEALRLAKNIAAQSCFTSTTTVTGTLIKASIQGFSSPASTASEKASMKPIHTCSLLCLQGSMMRSFHHPTFTHVCFVVPPTAIRQKVLQENR